MVAGNVLIQHQGQRHENTAVKTEMDTGVSHPNDTAKRFIKFNQTDYFTVCVHNTFDATTFRRSWE